MQSLSLYLNQIKCGRIEKQIELNDKQGYDVKIVGTKKASSFCFSSPGAKQHLNP